MELSWSELPNLTFLIRRSQAGDRDAENHLFKLAYPQLKAIASRLLSRPGDRASLTAHDLVHDVYVDRLRNWKGAVSDRGHYLAVVTEAMKNQLIDRARREKARKRTPVASGPGFPWQSASTLPYEDILALDREITRMGKDDPGAAEVVRLRYYCGCSWEETAAAVGATVKVVRGDWEFASRWLRKRLQYRSSSSRLP